MFCNHCGRPYPADAHYCGVCGHPIDREAPAQKVSIPPGQQSPTGSESQAGPKREPTLEDLMRRIDELENKPGPGAGGIPPPDLRRVPPESQTLSMISSVGPYALGADIESLQGLVELTSLEYLAMPKAFPGESIFKSPPVDFLGCTWEIWIGSIQGCIYKILAQRTVSDPAEISTILDYCERRLGKPTKRKQQDRINWTTTIWSVKEGNVVVGYGGLASCQVNLALTSAVVVRSKSAAEKKGFLRRFWG